MFCNSLAIDLFLIIVDVSTFLVHQLKQFIVICRLICSKGSIAIGVFYRCLTKPFVSDVPCACDFQHLVCFTSACECRCFEGTDLFRFIRVNISSSFTFHF